MPSGDRRQGLAEVALDTEARRASGFAPKREPFDPEPHRERLRGWIAVILVALFASAVFASFLLFWLLPDKSSEIKDFLPLVSTPLTSVVSAVLGFYYGAQARRDG